MLVHLAMMLSTSNGWVLPPDDKAHDSSPLAAHDSAITGEVDGGRARRQLASNCVHSWSACPHRARSCPSEPCADACGLLARSDAWMCPDAGSGGSSCDDACDTGCTSSCDWCDDSCDTQCDGFFGSSCDGECNDGCDGSCDSGCTSSCDGGCDTCETLLWFNCDSSCSNGCSPCPYGQHSAASMSLVSPPSAPWPSRQASSRATPPVSSGPHKATPHARTITHTKQLTVHCVRAQARGCSFAVLTAPRRPVIRGVRPRPRRCRRRHRRPALPALRPPLRRRPRRRRQRRPLTYWRPK